MKNLLQNNRKEQSSQTFELSLEVKQKIALIIRWAKLQMSFIFTSIQMFLFLEVNNFFIQLLFFKSSRLIDEKRI